MYESTNNIPEDLQEKLRLMRPYSVRTCGAMVGLGGAVELALNMRDMAVIQEMKVVCNEIFEQAKTVLNSDTRNVLGLQ